MERQLTIDDITYKTGQLSPRHQFHVLRRLAPILANMQGIVSVLAAVKAARGEEGSTADSMAMMMGPLAKGLADMTDADVDYIINTCCAAARRKEGEGWAPLMSPDGQQFMYPLKMSDMLKIVNETVQGNLGNFFDLLVSAPDQ